MTLSIIPNVCRRHDYLMFKDNRYHCSKCDSVKYQYEITENMDCSTADGFKCSVCRAIWRFDEKKPCGCELPMFFATGPLS